MKTSAEMPACDAVSLRSHSQVATPLTRLKKSLITKENQPLVGHSIDNLLTEVKLSLKNNYNPIKHSSTQIAHKVKPYL